MQCIECKKEAIFCLRIDKIRNANPPKNNVTYLMEYYCEKHCPLIEKIRDLK